MDALDGNAEGNFGLGGADRQTDGDDGDCRMDFVGVEGKIDDCGSGRTIGATFLHACGFSFSSIAGGTLRNSCRHHAMMLAVAPAAHRHVRVCHGRREERRDQRQHEQQQQRDGENTTHEQLDAAMLIEELWKMS